jgi:hypothetical protein
MYECGGMAGRRCRPRCVSYWTRWTRRSLRCRPRLGGVTGDIEFAGEGTFERDAGGVGSWGGSIGVGYEPTDDLRNGFFE